VLALKCRRVVGRRGGIFQVPTSIFCRFARTIRSGSGGLGRFYPWIPADQAANSQKIRPPRVRINRTVRPGLFDWALSDVAVGGGAMGGILRDGLRQLMAKIGRRSNPGKAEADSSGSGGIGKYDWKAQLSRDNALDQEFIGVTHSLGSYLLFNTLNPEFASVAGEELSASDAARKTAEENAMRYIFERTSAGVFSLPTSLRCWRSRILKARRRVQRCHEIARACAGSAGSYIAGR